MDSTHVNSRVMNDEQQGTARGVTGTPSVYLNGRSLPFEVLMNYDSLRANIERELAAK
jgi:protein-disulfide isomerase